MQCCKTTISVHKRIGKQEVLRKLIAYDVNNTFNKPLPSNLRHGPNRVQKYRDAQTHFFIIPVYLQYVQVHSVNWLKGVDECLGEGRSLAVF
jgi:hypothetical protein